MTYNSLIVWPYDEQGRIIGEESWSQYPKDCLRRIDPANAPESFRRYVERRQRQMAA